MSEIHKELIERFERYVENRELMADWACTRESAYDNKAAQARYDKCLVKFLSRISRLDAANLNRKSVVMKAMKDAVRPDCPIDARLFRRVRPKPQPFFPVRDGVLNYATGCLKIPFQRYMPEVGCERRR